MKWIFRLLRNLSILAAVALLAGCAAMGVGDSVRVRMSGAEEIPPVKSHASGSGTIRVEDDGSVSGSFKTQGVSVLAAHVHEGAADQNGPVVIPLQKTGDNEWAVPPGAKLTASQLMRYREGRLYVNFHSAQYKGGEIRAQIRASTGGRKSDNGNGGSGY